MTEKTVLYFLKDSATLVCEMLKMTAKEAREQIDQNKRVKGY